MNTTLNTAVLSASQAQMANLILGRVQAAGWSPVVAAAAVANAYRESRLNPLASGDHGHSRGLFQLNDNGGAGVGMSVADRQNPEKNIDRILREMKASKAFSAVAGTSLSIPDVAKAFCVYVERPADKATEGAKSVAYALTLFPPIYSGNSAGGSALVRATSSTASPWVPAGLILGVGVLASALLLRRRAQRRSSPSF